MKIKKEVKNIFKKIPKEIKYILFLFLITRIALTIIGVMAQKLLNKGAHLTNYLLLNIWSVWDSKRYAEIAVNGYPTSMASPDYWYNGFFPLYSLFIRIVDLFFRSPYLSGIIVSNIFLIIAAIFLYKLVKLNSNKETSLRSIKYLFLFPTAFILSGVFSESLFLALLIIIFYYAKKENWLLTGILGFLLTLTRPYGVVVIFPLLYEYYRSKDFKIRKTEIDIIYFLLIPLGLVIFFSYLNSLTGDFFTYIHLKEVGGHTLSDPLRVIRNAIYAGIRGLSHGTEKLFTGIYAITMISLLVIFYKKIDFSHLLMGLMLVFIPIMSGDIAVRAIIRYMAVLFPLFIILAKITEKKEIDTYLTIFLALIQGFLMVFWTIQSYLIV